MEGSTPTIKLSRDPSQQHCLLLLVRLNTLKSCKGAWHWPLAQKGFENCVYPGIEETLFRLEITSSIWIEKYLRCVFRHHHGYYSCVLFDSSLFSVYKSPSLTERYIFNSCRVCQCTLLPKLFTQKWIYLNARQSISCLYYASCVLFSQFLTFEPKRCCCVYFAGWESRPKRQERYIP